MYVYVLTHDFSLFYANPVKYKVFGSYLVKNMSDMSDFFS